LTQLSLEIVRLGAKGDGVAEGPNGSIYVPRGIPGDRVLVDTAYGEPEIVRVETASPHRVKPFCKFFGTCGGCLMQEADEVTYSYWKRGLVIEAMAPLKAGERVKPLVLAQGNGRRRVTFHARRTDKSVEIGFMKARSHDLVSIDSCPLLTPGLYRASEIAVTLAARLAESGKPLDIGITETLGGLDVDLRGHGPAGSQLRRTLSLDAEFYDLARLSMHGDVIVERRSAEIQIGRARVVLPPGGFLQATQAGEDRLADLVTKALAKSQKVADLFSGVGTFAFRIAERAAVHAVESNIAAVNAMQRAIRETQGLKPLTIEARDLYRRPLLGPELNKYDAVVLDPPRAGAEAQMRALAASNVPLVISVSCHLGTFVRDAEILTRGGFELKSISPVDQFRYSSHIELVGVFERAAANLKRPRKLLG
jgi:23S rRNA (uracil1939-C5)-methyltransferase